jgi:hypothetical protein
MMPRPTNAMIPKLISSIKRFTNKQAGFDLWQTSYHDHIIRDEADYRRIWQYIDDNTPHIHNIKTIIEFFEDKLPLGIPDEKLIFFDILSAYYLNNRYPDFISKLSLQINELEAAKTLAQTKEVFSWLLTLKP